MLAKINRLKKNKDIQKVFEKGRIFKQDLLILKILSNDLNESRFTFVVSKKFSKKAVTRNKIKRKLREIVYLNLKKIQKGVDVIIIASPGLELKDFKEIKEMISKLFKKAKIINNK